MPTPVREQVLAAVATLLAAIPGVALYRNRTVPVATFPALVLRDGGMTPSDETLGFTDYRLRLDVEGWVSAGTDAELGPAISELHAAVVAALLADTRLGGIAVDLHEGETSDPEIDRGEGRAPVAVFSTAFDVRFWTREGDPFTAGP